MHARICRISFLSISPWKQEIQPLQRYTSTIKSPGNYNMKKRMENIILILLRNISSGTPLHKNTWNRLFHGQLIRQSIRYGLPLNLEVEQTGVWQGLVVAIL